MHRSLRIVPTLLPTSTNRGGAPAPLRYSGELSELLTTPTPTIGARDQLAGKFHDAPQTSPAHMFCTFQHTPANHFASQLTRLDGRLDGSMAEARWLDANHTCGQPRWLDGRLDGGLDGGLDGASMPRCRGSVLHLPTSWCGAASHILHTFGRKLEQPAMLAVPS